jgi:glycosyltransferase involved in cell wall biosynthesis
MSSILWLADYTLDEAPGGAQRSDDILIKKGRELGHLIYHVTHKTLANFSNFNEYGILITSNIQSILNEKKDVLGQIAAHKNHIRLEHDANAYLSQQDRAILFSNCTKTIFLTEFHYEMFLGLYGDIFKNVAIVPDPIDTNLFFDRKQERKEVVLYAGYQHELKGTSSFFEVVLSNPNNKFVISGWSSCHLYRHLSNSISNLTNLGITPYENMPDLYNKYKYLYYSPNLQEPLCRSLAEASLCGMEIICPTPNRIGCLHDIQKFGLAEFSNRCNNAQNMFWEVVK